ncbi:hypothetical protein ACFDR9_004636 [Janthinobacterium sp. CG_23.3]
MRQLQCQRLDLDISRVQFGVQAGRICASLTRRSANSKIHFGSVESVLNRARSPLNSILQSKSAPAAGDRLDADGNVRQGLGGRAPMAPEPVQEQVHLQAVLATILSSRELAVKRDEICFMHSPGRAGQHVRLHDVDPYEPPGRRVAARGPTPRVVGRTTHAARVEDDVRQESTALRPLPTQRTPVKSITPSAYRLRQWGMKFRATGMRLLNLIAGPVRLGTDIQACGGRRWNTHPNSRGQTFGCPTPHGAGSRRALFARASARITASTTREKIHVVK